MIAGGGTIAGYNENTGNGFSASLGVVENTSTSTTTNKTSERNGLKIGVCERV